jgi:hypothetical protein
LALASPTSGCRSVGVFRSRTKATESVSHCYYYFDSLFSERKFTELKVEKAPRYSAVYEASRLLWECTEALCVGRRKSLGLEASDAAITSTKTNNDIWEGSLASASVQLTSVGLFQFRISFWKFEYYMNGWWIGIAQGL